MGLDMLLRRAFARPALRNRSVGAATLMSSTSDGEPWKLHVRFRTPVERWERASELMRERIETEPPSHPIDDLSLTISDLGGETGVQAGLIRDARESGRETLVGVDRRLSARFGGAHALHRAVEVAPWHPAPEMRSLLVPIDPLASDSVRALHMPAPAEVRETGMGGERRPGLLLRDGNWRPIERIDERWKFDLWWLPQPMTRSYYRVESADGTLHHPVSRRGHGPVVHAGRVSRVMSERYVELHAKSFYSFGEGASHVHELATRAVEHGQIALALTDTNLCGALEFANLAGTLGLKAITGGELTLTDGSRITLLAKSRAGYSNLSQLLTFANRSDRREPRLDAEYLPTHADVADHADRRQGRQRWHVFSSRGDTQRPGRMSETGYRVVRLRTRCTSSSSETLLDGDTRRNRRLAHRDWPARWAFATGGDQCRSVPRCPKDTRLQHALVAIRNNSTIDRSLEHILPNDQFHLKPGAEMEALFADCPEAVSNTVEIAERCGFDLSSDLGYTLPEPDVPDGYTPMSYLVRLCYEAAVRRYGSITGRVESRLQEEFRLIERNGMAGFLLLYREIALLARQVMEERGLVGPGGRA